MDATPGTPDLSDFAHLHLHTQYSLLDGAIRTKDLCRTVHERGMTSVAVTDHGNMFGTIQFYEEAKKWGVKPILGCEAYISDGPAAARSDRKNYHLVLLARTNEGFANLQWLVSKGYLEGFYYSPRIDRTILREHSKGLIGLSACMSGHVSRLVLEGRMDEARERVLEYKDIFEPGSYFLLGSSLVQGSKLVRIKQTPRDKLKTESVEQLPQLEICHPPIVPGNGLRGAL